jgi:hypothetical protein
MVEYLSLNRRITMRNNNLPSGGVRTSEVGLVYVEVLSGTTGTIEVPKYSAVRIRASAAGTVTIDGVLACTLAADEIIILNVGRGSNIDSKDTVTVIFSGAVYAQVGQEVERTR